MRATSILYTLLLAFTVTIATTATSAEPEKLQVMLLGNHSIGAPLSEVHRYTAVDNCVIEQEKADCAFIDSDGVEYVVLDDVVIAVIASEKTVSRILKLPFDLHYGDSIEVAIQKLIVGNRVWLVGSDYSGGVTLSSYNRYAGIRDWDFNIEIRFEQGRLVEIKYNSGSI